MLLWGSVLLKQLYNLDLKFKENWSKKGRTIKTSFFRYSYRNSFRRINLIQKSLEEVGLLNQHGSYYILKFDTVVQLLNENFAYLSK